jgi:hypothetical protein
MNCTDNLDKCKAMCCKLLPFDLNIPIGHPLEDYYRKRGLSVTRTGRGTIRVIIPHRCAQLTPEDHCKLHNTPSKPHTCTAFNEENAHNGKYHIPTHCIYEKKQEATLR